MCRLYRRLTLLALVCLGTLACPSERALALEILAGPFLPDSGNWTTVPDGSFESGNTAAWTDQSPIRGVFRASNNVAAIGQFSAQAIPAQSFNGSGFSLFRWIPVVSGETYVLSGFFHTANIPYSLYLDLGDVAFEPMVRGNYGVSEWQFAWDTFTVPVGVSSVRVRLVRDGDVTVGEYGYIDEVAITSVSGFVPPVGALVVDATTVQLWGNQQFSDVQVINGGSIVVPPSTLDGSTWIGGYLMLDAPTIFVDSTSSIRADGVGFSSDPDDPDGLTDGGPGHGPDGGDVNGALSGGGAGFGNSGGSCQTTTQPGSPYGSSSQDDTNVASLFGSAGGDYVFDAGQPPFTIPYRAYGGRGGGYIRLRGANINVEGTVTANGAAGGVSDPQHPGDWAGIGGGGGSGGQIVIDGDVVSVTGTFQLPTILLVTCRGGRLQADLVNGAEPRSVTASYTWRPLAWMPGFKKRSVSAISPMNV